MIVVAQTGAAVGIATLLSCEVVRVPPAGAARVVADAPDDALVVVHDPRPDDAGHARRRAAKVAALEGFDAAVVGPVADVISERGGAVAVCPDHGCDPPAGRHSPDPVPALTWSPHARPPGSLGLTEVETGLEAVSPHGLGHLSDSAERVA